MNINQHPYSKFSNCHNFLFHPLYEKKRTAMAIAAHLIISAVSFGLWQIPFWIVNCLDRKWSANPKNHTKMSSLISETFKELSTAAKSVTKLPTPKSTAKQTSVQASGTQEASIPEPTASQDASIDTPSSHSKHESSKKNTAHGAPSTHAHSASKSTSEDDQDSSTKSGSSKAASQPKAQPVPSQIPSVVHQTKPFPDLLSLPKGDWMKPANPYPFMFGITPAHHVSSIRDIPSSLLDSYLLDQPLGFFGSSSFVLPAHTYVIAKAQDQVKVIKERIAQLNQAIQLEERYKKLGNPLLTVRDIMVSWEDSQLQYALMMDEELLTLKASDVSRLSLFTVARRVRQLAQSQKISVDQDALTSSSIQDMLVVDMAHLTGATFNRLGKNVPPIAFTVISPEAIPELEMTSLTKKQQKVFFSVEGRVHLLSIDQVNACVSNIKLKFLSNLSDKQIHNLDFSQINKDIFEAIFKKSSTRMPKLLQAYDLDRIYEICHYFEDYHWKALSDKQIHRLDFEEIGPEIFKVIFEPHKWRTQELIFGYDMAGIHKNCQYFADCHWKALSDTQIHGLDFAKIDGKIFNLIFPANKDRTRELLQKYDLPRIYEICKYFQGYHWKSLSDKQIHDLDFSKIDDKIFKMIFEIKKSRTEELLQDYELARIYEICKYFEDDHWKALSEKQIRDLDFSKINDKIFNVIFPKNKAKTEERLQDYELVRIYEICKYFEDYHWKALSDKQIQGFDFTKIDEKIFKVIFALGKSRTEELLSGMSDEQIVALKPFLKAEWHKYLSDHQKLLIA